MVKTKNSLPLDGLFELLQSCGGGQYGGEPVTQLEHALQTAALALDQGASAELIAAALFHDIGHLTHGLGEDATARGVDDHHEARAVGILRPLFGDAMWRPVSLHVQAKRYLCATDPVYAQTLSDESRRSLALQGAAMTGSEAHDFLASPYARDAIRLRRWDDLAKVAGAQTPTLAWFRKRIANAT